MAVVKVGVSLLCMALCGCDPGPDEPAHVALLDEIRAQMVQIPAGRFRMGSRPPVAEDEQPAHEVALKRFKLARFEVTAAQFAVFAAASGRTVNLSADPQQPAVNVSWDDARAFIDWLNTVSGESYRLPTEAEWEYAARAGSTTTYWWGDTFEPERLNGTGMHGRDRWLEIAPVGQFAPNGFGLYDMLGNVWEWTADCYHSSYAGAPADGSAPPGPTSCTRVLRGGSWSDEAEWLRSATRNWFDAAERFDYIGLRLAQD